MTKTVLVVDDNAYMRRLLRGLVEEENDMEVVGEAGNGVEAVEMYKEYHPDVVMMDVMMPVKNGIEATEDIKELNGDARIIMCTANEQEDSIEKAKNAEAEAYIVKPFKKDSVLEAIENAFRS